MLIGTASSFPAPTQAALRGRARTARRDGMPGVLQAKTEGWFTARTIAERPNILDRVREALLARDPVVHAAMWEMIADLDVTAAWARSPDPP